MAQRPQRLVSTETELHGVLEQAKLMLCPHCGRLGTLIGHGWLRGYAERGAHRVLRGRRLFCSNRFRRPGCGRTWSIWLDSVIPSFTVRCSTLAAFVRRVVSGSSRSEAWRHAAQRALSVSSGYRLWQRLQRAQAFLRTKLSSVCPPPTSTATTPWAQLLEHLEHVVSPAACPFAAFQSRFQARFVA